MRIFVVYVARTNTGKRLRNCEAHMVPPGKIARVEFAARAAKINLRIRPVIPRPAAKRPQPRLWFRSTDFAPRTGTFPSLSD
jgi:hypothetical protein